jgi:hypothetical protein
MQVHVRCSRRRVNEKQQVKVKKSATFLILCRLPKQVPRPSFLKMDRGPQFASRAHQQHGSACRHRFLASFVELAMQTSSRQLKHPKLL